MGYGYDGSPCTKECAFFVLLQKGGGDPIKLLSSSSSSPKQESKTQGPQRTSQPKRTRPASHTGTISSPTRYSAAPKASSLVQEEAPPVYEPTPPALHQFKVSLPKRASFKAEYSPDEDEYGKPDYSSEDDAPPSPQRPYHPEEQVIDSPTQEGPASPPLSQPGSRRERRSLHVDDSTFDAKVPVTPPSATRSSTLMPQRPPSSSGQAPPTRSKKTVLERVQKFNARRQNLQPPAPSQVPSGSEDPCAGRQLSPEDQDEIDDAVRVKLSELSNAPNLDTFQRLLGQLGGCPSTKVAGVAKNLLSRLFNLPRKQEEALLLARQLQGMGRDFAEGSVDVDLSQTSVMGRGPTFIKNLCALRYKGPNLKKFCGQK